MRTPEIAAIDLFCGLGGLTHGLRKSGINVSLGVDLDPACRYPYISNNESEFWLRSVSDLKGSELLPFFKGSALTLLAGCAPCQPFSTYSQGWASPSDHRWDLLGEFSRLVGETRPHFVTMENVPGLRRLQVFHRFVDSLKQLGYDVSHSIVACSDYGVPQMRKRLVLLASKLGPVELVEPAKRRAGPVTVRSVIEKLPPIEAGGICEKDQLHQASGLSEINLARIQASVPGGSWRDWPSKLVADCHRKSSGKRYVSVYGRMEWDLPSPTITTQFHGFGNGRFGHPEQDRALSLREGAMLQSFPRTYKFAKPGEQISREGIARLIGNAVPVRLGEVIGKSFMRHIKNSVGID